MIPEGSCSSGTIPEYSGAGIFTYSNSHLNGSGEPPWTCGEHSLTHSLRKYLSPSCQFPQYHTLLPLLTMATVWHSIQNSYSSKRNMKFWNRIWNLESMLFNFQPKEHHSCLYFHFSFFIFSPRPEPQQIFLACHHSCTTLRLTSISNS